MTLAHADSLSSAETQQSRHPEQSKFRPDIEGLRAVAVLAVVLFHADIPGVSGGFVGVDVFFVISGFLITGLLWREVHGTGKVRLARFYGARARRLLPASAFVGVFIMLGSAFLLPPLQAKAIIADGIASTLYVSNYRFILQGTEYHAVITPPSPFQHYWSLGVEEQFYLVWAPLILGTTWLIQRARRRPAAEATISRRPYLVVLAVVLAGSFTLSLFVTNWAPIVAFFSLPTRAWELAAGGLVAMTADQWHRLSPRGAAVVGWTGLSVVLVACNQLGATTPYPGTAALLPVLGTVMVIGAGCATPTKGCARVLAFRPMQAIGRVSYSWYLWHWPVLMVALWSVAPFTGHGLWLGLGGALFSLGLAALTLRFVENPLRFAPGLRQSPQRSLAVGAVATVVAVCVGAALLPTDPVGHGAPAARMELSASPPPPGSSSGAYDGAVQQTFAQAQAAVAASADLKAVPSNLQPPLADTSKKSRTASNGCVLGYFDVKQPECATGDTASKTTVAVIGDSNAAMWSPAFDQLAAQRHWRLETLTKGVCPMLDLPIINPIVSREYIECEQWRTQIIDRLQAEHPRLIVLSMLRRYGARFGWAVGFTSYETPWLDSMTRLVKQLRATGAQVLVLGPIPDPGSVVPNCLSVHLDNATACSPPRSAAVNSPGIAGEAAATMAGGGQYVDITDLFCTPQRCPVIVGDTLVYQDESHLTSQYARALAPAVGALSDRALAHG